MSSVGSGTSGSNSGYGTLVDVPTLAMAAGLAGGAYAQDNDDSAAEYYQRRGPILTPGELSRLDEETSEARHEEARGYSPLIPPPPLNPDQFGVRGASATSLPRPGTPAFLSGTFSFIRGDNRTYAWAHRRSSSDFARFFRH